MCLGEIAGFDPALVFDVLADKRRLLAMFQTVAR